ncbi:hypothetical protein H4R33_004989, partial [Dimargaris cristalligena]
TCPGSQCCSKWGYCGAGDSFCGAGCQNGPCSGGSNPQPTNTSNPPTNPTPTNGGGSSDGSCSASKPCPAGQCCSKWGWCGTGASFCS